MSLSFHVDFNGQCEEAFGFYAATLGGKIGSMLCAGSRDGKVVHATICIDGVHVAGADVEPDRYEKPRGFHVLLGVDSEDRVKSIFAALQRDGEVVLAPQKTFWSPCYAIVVDRFGVPWKLNCVLSA